MDDIEKVVCGGGDEDGRVDRDEGTAGVHAKETGGVTGVKSGFQKRQGFVFIPFGAATGRQGP